MIFSTLKLKSNEAIDTQLINHILKGIEIGELKKDSKLPSTREVSSFLKISRSEERRVGKECRSRWSQ